jgi:hypothetical protein
LFSVEEKVCALLQAFVPFNSGIVAPEVPVLTEAAVPSDGVLDTCEYATWAQLAVPAAATPVAYCPPEHCAGADAKAVAVAALPVVGTVRAPAPLSTGTFPELVPVLTEAAVPNVGHVEGAPVIAA